MRRPRYKRAPDHPPAHREPEVPVVLPHIIMTVASDGSMTITVDGKPYPPEPFAPSWRRESFPSLIDRLTNDRQCPIRVEVREADGAVFTDIIAPSKTRRPAPEPPPKPSVPVVAPAAVPTAAVVQGEGYVPGEDVAVAVIVAHADAAPTGTARALVTAEQLALSPTGEVILLGRISGTLALGRPT
ncbi:hypothetical protein GCM10022198_06530 [Klugiella xanthotipulae]|uniref:Uncharacterized protein n=1 Tax=Klugiella xanthotipulae TaxID=244735 RepID=A0A543HTG7_9MICO|nr:hypothetical protein [Klugiella xanthotipulae]TQM61580.1 hypothetical protein FB466_2539 [Klugiella xanthotipulae]